MAIDLEKADSPELKTSSSDSSSSGSTDKTSPPSTPPDEHDEQYQPEALLRLQHPPYSATPPRRNNRRPSQSTPTRRLGAIDEDTSSIAPDIPTRNPNRPRKMVRFMPTDAKQFFSWSAYSRPGTDVPPPNAYDGIVGPRGEKFQDVRQNKPFTPAGRGGWRKFVCLGLVLFLIIVIGLGVGLGVGLNKNKGARTEDILPLGTSNIPQTEVFPLGTYSIPTYLTSISTDCTANPATWRCYPYSTYAESATSSFSTLSWRITSPTNSTLDLRISSTNPTFSYPFTDTPMTLRNANDARQSAFAFSFTYRKLVVPNADITGDNQATRCYYNGTTVAARLFTRAEGGGGNVTGPPGGYTTQSGQVAGSQWPYAIEFEETITEGPQCFRYANGVEGEQVAVAAGTAEGQCECAYRNYGLS